MKNNFLIVDDNEMVLETTACLVKHITGRPVHCCKSAAEAIRAYEKSPDDYACVITDLNMPGMNGLELGDHFRILAPGLKLMLITGNIVALETIDAHAFGFECVLPKPFNIAQMKSALDAVLVEPDDFFASKSTLNNFPVPRTQGLYEAGVSYFERLGGMIRAVA